MILSGISFAGMIARWRVGALAIASAGLGLVGCGPASPPKAPNIVTVTVPAPSAPAESAGTAPASAAHKTQQVLQRRLPGTCDSLLPLGTIIDALGTNIGGATAFVVGLPDPSEAKIGYIDCQYAISKGNPVAGIEIGVNLYRTRARAAARIQPTVADFAAHGASAARSTVAGRSATVLTGGTGTGYGPTVVTAVGQRTIAVSFRAGLVPAGQVTHQLLVLAALAEQRSR